MRRLLTPLFLALILASAIPTAHAQQGDMAYFASFEGLNRVVARAWAAQMSIPSSGATASPVASPAATPMATPETPGGVEALSIFVYLFDSDKHAAAGFERIDADLQKTVLHDPRAPLTSDLPLDQVGDQAVGYMGDMAQDGTTVSFTFATIQDGPFVYSISGMFTGVDSASLTHEYASALVAQPIDRMTEQFDQNGGSRGGIWSKFNGINPNLAPGGSIVDFMVYPMPEESTSATPSS